MDNIKKDSVKKNFIYNLIYEIFIILVPFATAAYTARIFEADGVGIYSFTNTISAYAILFGNLGIMTYGQRQIASKGNDLFERTKNFIELFILRTVFSLFFLLVYLIIAFGTARYKTYLISFSVLIIANLFDISWFFRGIEKFKFVSIWQIFTKLATLICLFTFVKEKNDLNLYILIIGISTIIGNILMWTGLKGELFNVEFKSIRPFNHLRGVLVYFIPAIASTLYTWLDRLMIGWITGDDFENGYYEQATKIIALAKSFVLTINVVMASRITFLYEEKKYDEIKIRLQNTCDFILLISLPAVIGVIYLASDCVPLFFGEGYSKVVDLLLVLAPVIFVGAIGNMISNCYFLPFDLRKQNNAIILIGSCINILINVPLIIFFKSVGAAIASLVAESVITILYMIKAKDWFDWKKVFLKSVKKLLSCFAMVIVICIMKSFLVVSWLSLITEVIVGMFVYFVMEIVCRDSIVIDYLNAFIKKLKKSKKEQTKENDEK